MKDLAQTKKYQLENTRSNSKRYGACDVCGKNTFTENIFRRTPITEEGVWMDSMFGHESCLLSVYPYLDKKKGKTEDNLTFIFDTPTRS